MKSPTEVHVPLLKKHPDRVSSARLFCSLRIVATLLAVFFQSWSTSMAGEAGFATNLAKAVADLETAPTIWDRELAGRALKTAVGSADADREELDPILIARIIALMNTDEDNVRIYVASVLGWIGPRAKAAVPRSLEVLPEVDCVRASLNSSPVIRQAMEKMGVAPPPLECGPMNGPNRSATERDPDE